MCPAGRTALASAEKECWWRTEDRKRVLELLHGARRQRDQICFRETTDFDRYVAIALNVSAFDFHCRIASIDVLGRRQQREPHGRAQGDVPKRNEHWCAATNVRQRAHGSP